MIKMQQYGKAIVDDVVRLLPRVKPYKFGELNFWSRIGSGLSFV